MVCGFEDGDLTASNLLAWDTPTASHGVIWTVMNRCIHSRHALLILFSLCLYFPSHSFCDGLDPSSISIDRAAPDATRYDLCYFLLFTPDSMTQDN